MASDKEGASPETPPAFEVKDGKVFMDGVDVTEIARPGGEDELPEPANVDNAALEGDEAEKPEPEEKKESVEAKKEDVVPEKKPDEKPAEPAEPDKLKFKLKFRGKEEEVEYEPTQIQVRLNKLRAFEENEKEFWEKTREVEPHRAIISSDWYKAKLKEAYESGELAAPEAPEAPPVKVQYEIAKRRNDPDYLEIQEAVLDYARTRSREEQLMIDSDAEVYISEFDRLAKEVREKKVPPIPVAPKVDPADVKKQLALKESAKIRAAVVAPGTMPEQRSQATAVQKRMRELERAMRDPSLANRNLEFAAELIMLRQQSPT